MIIDHGSGKATTHIRVFVSQGSSFKYVYQAITDAVLVFIAWSLSTISRRGVSLLVRREGKRLKLAEFKKRQK